MTLTTEVWPEVGQYVTVNGGRGGWFVAKVVDVGWDESYAIVDAFNNSGMTLGVDRGIKNGDCVRIIRE